MNWKSNTLIFLTYNNYYNRIVKKEEILQDYLKYELFRLSATNFNPADGVNTVHRINMADGLYPDYIVAIDEHNEIISRWFIIESDRVCGGQYDLTLHRDLIVDYYDDIVDAPCFIEKATLNAEDPLIFNNEDMSFNEIKSWQYKITDPTKCSWIVGYYAKDTPATVLSGSVPLNPLNDVYDILIDTKFENWKYNATEVPIKASIDNIHYKIYGNRIYEEYTFWGYKERSGYIEVNKDGNSYTMHFDKNLKASDYTLDFALNAYQCFWGNGEYATGMQPAFAAAKNKLYEEAKTYLPEMFTETELKEFLSLKNVIVKDIEGKYYSVNIVEESNTYSTVPVRAGSLFNSLSDIVSTATLVTGKPNSNTFQIVAGFKTYSMVANELTGLETTWDMTAAKLTTEDAPYNIFAIPCGTCSLHNGITKITTSQEEYAFPLAQSIIGKLGDSLYDIQLLPYCPLEDIGHNLVRVKTAEAYSLVKDKDGNSITFILNIPKSNFTKNISYNIEQPSTSIGKKIANECYKYRICSPNYNGCFDFTPAKNNGVKYFNIDCTYKPFQPYIHVNPNFGGLYGQDFNDPRGLICSGDFSLSQYSSAWQNYQLQNKNYQAMFDRQIENMEVQNKYQREQDIWTAVAGGAQGAITGAATGLMASGGNPYIAAAAGIAGAVTSGLAGARDIKINQALRNEAIDYTKDNFGYQLGNIKALPYTLTKVSSFNENNAIWPVLECYKCTSKEENAFVNKLAYNGMTVMAIGTINDYIGNKWTYTIDGKEIKDKGYIKGKIIRLPEINEDFHIANEIAKEVNMGMYIGGQE